MSVHAIYYSLNSLNIAATGTVTLDKLINQDGYRYIGLIRDLDDREEIFHAMNWGSGYESELLQKVGCRSMRTGDVIRRFNATGPNDIWEVDIVGWKDGTS